MPWVLLFIGLLFAAAASMQPELQGRQTTPVQSAEVAYRGAAPGYEPAVVTGSDYINRLNHSLLGGHYRVQSIVHKEGHAFNPIGRVKVLCWTVDDVLEILDAGGVGQKSVDNLNRLIAAGLCAYTPDGMNAELGDKMAHIKAEGEIPELIVYQVFDYKGTSVYTWVRADDPALSRE